jgi:hypothetical protein
LKQTTSIFLVIGAIVVLTLAVSSLISLIGGWIFLARKYPERPFKADQTFSLNSAYFGRIIGGYRTCISVRMNSFGLRLAIFPLFRFMHPPIVIPWSAVRNCAQSRLFGFCPALRLDVAQWPRPIYLYSFLGKYGDVRAKILLNWKSSGVTPPSTSSK